MRRKEGRHDERCASISEVHLRLDNEPGNESSRAKAMQIHGQFCV